jgi:hypothetical protein
MDNDDDNIFYLFYDAESIQTIWCQMIRLLTVEDKSESVSKETGVP